MQHFALLDTLLQRSFDTQQKHRGDKALNAQYLSSDYIQEELSEPYSKLTNIQTLDRLKERLKLSDIEMKIILILFAPEVAGKYERIYAYLQDNMNKTYPTVQLLNILLCETQEETQNLFDYFIKPSKFTLLNLIEFNNDIFQTLLFQQPLRLSDALRNYLMGDHYLEGVLQPYSSVIEPVKDQSKTPEIVTAIEKGLGDSERYLINIYGKASKNKKQEALKIASHFGFGLLCVDTKEALQKEPDLTKLTAMLIRDALLSGTVLYFEAFDAMVTSHTQQTKYLFTKLGQLAWLTFFSTTTRWSPSEIPKHQHYYTMPTKETHYTEREAYWRETLTALDCTLPLEIASDLANTFQFSEDEIDNIKQLLQTEKSLGKNIDKALLFSLSRSRISSNLSQYAQAVNTVSHLKDMVIPEKTKEALEKIMVHYRYKNKVFQIWGYENFFQSQGLTLLFSGASGTGKTMAASVLATTLGLELYKIDLSQMISKYIGETEKHLAKLFQVARESGVILFFDEADAIFGKRTELKDSHDRYANIEVSYLLQSIEEYEGIVILASNYKENIDEAFLRRLRFVIDFPVPDADQRRELWYKLLPQSLLDKPIEFTNLAKKFKLSGANIRNVALYAAFNAAGEEKKIDVNHISDALKSELEKIGLEVNKDDFERLM